MAIKDPTDFKGPAIAFFQKDEVPALVRDRSLVNGKKT